MPTIRLDSDSPEQLARWRAALDGSFEFGSPSDIPAVTLTDRADRRASSLAARTEEVQGTIRLVENSVAAPLDAEALSWELPADASSRELILACRALSEIVRLRRALFQADEAQAQLAEEALHDPLTGLSNRRAWDLELARRTAPESPAVPLAIAVFDLDHFKEVNDSAGHLKGDEVLVQAAGLLRGALRQRDLLARVGGDEFGLLLAGVSEASAREVIERVRGAVRAAGLTASAGWSWSPTVASPGPLEQWAAADRALQRAKQAGGDRSERAGEFSHD
jgi:diguanylate cyclase (GGDEF)-like protein